MTEEQIKNQTVKIDLPCKLIYPNALQMICEDSQQLTFMYDKFCGDNVALLLSSPNGKGIDMKGAEIYITETDLKNTLQFLIDRNKKD